MNEKDRMFGQMLYHPCKVDINEWSMIRKACKDFNDSCFWQDDTAFHALKKCFGKASEDMTLIPPFYCDHGDRIYFGNHFYANTDCTILDENKVCFGDNVFLGPHVSIYTAGHPIDALVRSKDLEYARPVTIGNDVWIGGNTVINPGVTIGSDVVIGSGSLVTRDIPDHVIAAGNPCRIIREISDEERSLWKRQYQEYINDKDIK